MAEIINSAFMAQPAGSEDASLGDDRIRSFKAAFKERLEKEHYLDLAEAGAQPRQGLHRAGSAVAFYQASAPTTRNGIALGASDAGILWVSSTSGNVAVYSGSSWISIGAAPPVGATYFRGPHDAAPSTLWAGTTWTDVSYEEANLGRRVVGNMAGAMFGGTPARLSASVASGVPAISIVSGGSGYLSGGSGTINLIISGACTTQMVANATVTSGKLTAINVTTAGAGYTSGALAVYDGVVGHGDLVQGSKHLVFRYGTGSGNLGSDTQTPATHSTGGGGILAYEMLGFTAAGNPANCGISGPNVSDTVNGLPRIGPESTGPWIAVTKYRRTA